MAGFSGAQYCPAQVTKGLRGVTNPARDDLMIELHQFRPVLGLPNASPFCMKAETYLLYRGIPYQPVPSSPRKSPSRQVPFVVDGARTVTDTEAIMDHFEAGQAQPLDSTLNPRQHAMAGMIRQQVEQDLFWQITYMRWGDPQGWARFAPILKAHLPRAMRGPAIFIIRRHLLRRMRQRGLRPDDPGAAYARGKAQLDSLSDFLGDSGFSYGNTPGRLDMTLYAFIANIMDQEHRNPLQDHARNLENLTRYCARMHRLTFGKPA